jgi:antitoxin ParD1/3/4
MATMNISSPDPMRDWVQAQIQAGKYASNSDYVRDLIRQDHERRNQLQHLQQAITDGLESGIAEDFDLKAFLQEMKVKHLR